MNRWHPTEELKNKYTPIIKDFLERISKLTPEKIEYLSDENLKQYKVDFTDIPLAPYHIWKIIEELKEFGYEKSDINDNGWEQDFWIYFNSSKGYQKLVLDCCGMTRECILKLEEID